ncbi:hypothetical protein PROFUN_16956, partial [Planoprotostelium fungivorum]
MIWNSKLPVGANLPVLRSVREFQNYFVVDAQLTQLSAFVRPNILLQSSALLEKSMVNLEKPYIFAGRTLEMSKYRPIIQQGLNIVMSIAAIIPDHSRKSSHHKVDTNVSTSVRAFYNAVRLNILNNYPIWPKYRALGMLLQVLNFTLSGAFTTRFNFTGLNYSPLRTDLIADFSSNF